MLDNWYLGLVLLLFWLSVGLLVYIIQRDRKRKKGQMFSKKFDKRPTLQDLEKELKRMKEKQIKKEEEDKEEKEVEKEE